MKNKFLLWFWILFPLLVFSQGENDNWYFGNQAAVNFTGTTPVVLNNSQMIADEGCGTVSDSNGNLLFYTNGMYIWNREHQIMPNSLIGISATLSSQQLMIVKDPSNINRYYVFNTATINLPSTYISYTIVDMSLGSLGTDGFPLGEVLTTHKNIQVLDDNNNPINTEAITAVKHADGESFWILIPHGLKLYAYKLDNLGFNPIPVTSNMNFNAPLTNLNYYGIKASPRLNKGDITHYLSISSIDYGGRVYSFNNSMGMIITGFTLNLISISSYSSEFNKDGSILYIGRFSGSNPTGTLFSVDLINSTTTPVYYQIPLNNHVYFQIQRNKHNEIYISSRFSNYLAKILNPDTYGASSVNYYDTYLNGNTAGAGLPQLVLSHDDCIPNIVLSNPETNNNYTHQAKNSITTQSNYSINNNTTIDMKAGDFIALLPNTHIKQGANYLGKIEKCLGAKPSNSISDSLHDPIDLTINLDLYNDEALKQKCKVYPNPSTSYFTIDSNNEIIEKWELYDISGRLVQQGKENTNYLNNFSNATYVLKIYLANGNYETHKLIIK